MTSAPPAGRPTVLVADDEPDIRELARMLLEMDGFDVVAEAVDGEQALTRAKRFLLVIADSATLGDHPYYARFLRHVDAIDAHGSAWSDDAPPLA